MAEHAERDAYATLSVSADGDGRIGLLTLDRPERANAIDTRMAGELLDFFSALAVDQRGWRCLIVTGRGKAFCAGGDLKERSGMGDSEWRAQHALIERMILAMLDCPIPIMAAVNGAAYGGGCEIVLNCDFAYAAEDAVFALTETRLGIFPGAGGTQNLPRAAGIRRAKELIFSARPFSAAEAHDWGIVNQVFPSRTLLTAAVETAERIAANAPLAIRRAKQAIDIGMTLPLRDGLQASAEIYDQLVPSEDRREGVRAFVEKRAPRFDGR
jgi:enoyl-CoA hydratase/carnithine racemase